MKSHQSVHVNVTGDAIAPPIIATVLICAAHHMHALHAPERHAETPVGSRQPFSHDLAEYKIPGVEKVDLQGTSTAERNVAQLKRCEASRTI